MRLKVSVRVQEMVHLPMRHQVSLSVEEAHLLVRMPFHTTATSCPVVTRKKTWRKTIVLVSVRKSAKGKLKCGTVNYDVITQVVVHLTPATCNVKEVSQPGSCFAGLKGFSAFAK